MQKAAKLMSGSKNLMLNKIWHNKNIRFLPFRVLILVICRSFFHDWDDSNCCLYFTQNCHVHCFTPILNLNFCQKKLEWKLAQYRIGQVKLAAAAVLYDSIWIQPLIFSFDYELCFAHRKWPSCEYSPIS